MMDTFTRYLHPEVGDAALAVFAAAGVRAAVVDPGCCGRALYSQGRLDAARRHLNGRARAPGALCDRGRPDRDARALVLVDAHR